MYNRTYAAPRVTNCILWGNQLVAGISIETNSVYAYDGAKPIITYSDVEGGCDKLSGCTTDETGNIGQDPLFINAAAGNLRLQAGSSCLDVADGTAPILDMDGNARVDIVGTGNDVSNYADLGVYEYKASN